MTVYARGMRAWLAGTLAALILLTSADGIDAQGRRAGGPPPTARTAAGLDLTGIWVSVVSEDWRYRMVTPPRGDYDSMPLTDTARKIADAWDPAKDEASGTQCKAYGAPALMRIPGRIRISWQDDQTLKVEAEAGTQTRLFHFEASRSAPRERTWQGHSVTQWEYAGPARGRAAGPRRGHLKVVTTNLRPGYLRKNGVPYSESIALTEYYNRTEDPVSGDTWLIVTTMIDDPQYLNRRFVTSTHFKKLPASDSGFTPDSCSAT